MCLGMFWLVYELEGLSDAGVGCFTIRASYQTFVLNLSIDKRQGAMRYYDYALTGAASAEQQPGDKAWLSGGDPKTACTSVDCGLPFGSQLPRPLVD